MKKGKKLLCLLLCLCLLLPACGKKGAEDDGRGPVNGKPGEVVTKTETTKPTETIDAGSLPIYAKDPTGSEAEAEQDKFDELMKKIFVELVQTDSLSLHFVLEHPEEYGITEKEIDFGSVDSAIEYAEFCKKYQSELESIDYKLLKTGQKVNYDRLAYEFGIGIESGELKPLISTAFSNNNGLIPNGTTYYTEYPIVERKDADAFLELMRSYPQYLELAKESMEQEKSQGLYPSQDQIDTTLEYLEGLAKDEGHPFIASFQNNLQEATDLSDEEREEYVTVATEILVSEILPAVSEITSYVEKFPTAKKEGLGKTEDGKAYYTYLAQTALGIDMSMEDLFKYMEKKKTKMFTSLTMAIAMDADAYTRYEEATTELSDPAEMLEDLKKQANEHFPKIPDTEYQVSYLPKETEVDGVLAYYLHPQVDWTKRRIMRVNKSAVENGVTLYNTLAHEGYPGHLYQDAFFMNTDGCHEMNSLVGYLGYTEGWAVFAAGKSYHWILDDKNVEMLFNFDYNYSMLMVSIIDVGVNYYGWSREDVKDYLDENMVDGEEFGDYFFDTVADDPALYLPYTAGFLMVEDTIKELTDRGLSEMEAYEAFLTVGPAPFPIVKKYLGLE